MNKEIRVLEKLDNEYTLIDRGTQCQPFVVVLGFNPIDGDWCQGHYFDRVSDALDWYDSRCRGYENDNDNNDFDIDDVIFGDDDYIDLDLDDDDFDKIVTELLGF